jgi:hypothetical protein
LASHALYKRASTARTACRSVSDPAVVVVLVIGLLVSLRVVASATREKDGRARPERTACGVKLEKKLNITAHRLDQRRPATMTTPPAASGHAQRA